MTRKTGIWAWALAAVAAWASGQTASAVTLYREDFTDAEMNDGTLADIGWVGTDIGAGGNSAGIYDTFHWWYNNVSLASMTANTGLSYTTENPPISTATPLLTLSWAQRLERQFDDGFGDASGTGTGPDVRPAVLIGGQWYASAAAVSTGNVTSAAYTAHSLAFNAAAANWVLVGGVDGSGGVTLGAAPGANLSGDIAGVGLVSTFHQYQTVNFDYFEVSGVPEPASLGLAALGVLAAAAVRRRLV